MSILNYILESVLQYKVKKQLGTNSEYQQDLKELKQLIDTRDGLIKKYNRERDEAEKNRPKSMRVENGKIFDDKNNLCGLLKNDLIDFTDNYPAKIKDNKIYFLDINENDDSEVVCAWAEINNAGDIIYYFDSTEEKLGTVKLIRKVIQGECEDIIKAAVFVFMKKVMEM
jgi:hypothetical protein